MLASAIGARTARLKSQRPLYGRYSKLQPIPVAELGPRLRLKTKSIILNYMVQYLTSPLDLSFAALSDATRRGIIEQLGRAEASITSLADRFEMTPTGMKKHVQVLERAGLVVTQKVGRVRTCKLGEGGLKAEAEWIEAHRKLFEARFDALDDIISEMQQEERDGSKS